MAIEQSDGRVGASDNLRRIGRLVRRVAPLTLLTLLAVGSAAVAAVASTRNAALSIFAGVIVGAIVTAAGTWVVGPTLERRIRRETQADEAVLELIMIAEEMRSPAGELSTLVGARNRRLLKLLGRMSKRTSTLRLLALRTRSKRVSIAVEEMISAIFDAWMTASYAVRDQPRSKPDGEPDDQATVVMAIRIGGALARSSEQPTEGDEEFDRLVRRVYPAVQHLLDVLREHGNYPEYARPARSAFTTAAERRLARELSQTIIAQLAEDDAICQSVGIELIAMRTHETGAEVSDELERLRIAEDLGTDPGATRIGRAALLQMVRDHDHARYPTIRSEVARMVAESVEPQDDD